MAKSVAVDLDGVLASYDGWEGLEVVGDPIPGARDMLEEIRDLGLEVVVYTTRLNPDPFNQEPERASPERLQAIVEGWLQEHDMPYDRVFTGRGKPIALAYVDDRAIPCRPQDNSVEEGFSATSDEYLRSRREAWFGFVTRELRQHFLEDD